MTTAVHKDKHNPHYSRHMGRVDIVMNPSIPAEVSKYDQDFFNKVVPGDRVSQEMSFFLDPLVNSHLLGSLNVYFCDTVVVNKGVVAYYLFNSDAGKGHLRVIRKANQLIFPVLTTYFVKRRALLYNRVAKKEPEFTNISHFFDLQKSKQESPYARETQAAVQIQPSATLVTEVATDPIHDDDVIPEGDEHDSQEFMDEQEVSRPQGTRERVASSNTFAAELSDSPHFGQQTDKQGDKGLSLSIKEIRLRPPSGKLHHGVVQPEVSKTPRLVSAFPTEEPVPPQPTTETEEQRMNRNSRDDTPNFAYYKLKGRRQV